MSVDISLLGRFRNLAIKLRLHRLIIGASNLLPRKIQARVATIRAKSMGDYKLIDESQFVPQLEKAVDSLISDP